MLVCSMHVCVTERGREEGRLEEIERERGGREKTSPDRRGQRLTQSVIIKLC